MWQRLFCIFLWTILAWPLTASALVLDKAAGLRDPLKLAGHIAARCVMDEGESIEDVAKPSRAAEFVALPELLVKGYTQQTCWLRFTLQRPADARTDWLLEVGVPYLDDVTLFLPSQPGEKGNFQILQMGDLLPYSERPIPHRLFIFPIHLSDLQATNAYLRIRTSSSMLVETLNLWQYTGLLAATQHEAALYWLVFGLITLGLLSNLVLWLWLREGIYRTYTFYLFALLVMNLTFSGFLTQWLWEQRPIVADRAVGVTASLTFFIGLVFFDNILGLKRSFPRIRWIIPVTLGIYALGILAAAAGHYSAVAPVIQLVALVATIGITLAGPWLLWIGQKHLWIYVLAFSTQLLIAIATFSRNLGLWPLEITIDHFTLGATTLHVVLLNFALVERVRQVQREKLALEKTAAHLESKQIALDQQQEFIAMVAHEFRTPLAIIDTTAQRIAGQLASVSEKDLERCSNIRNAVYRLTALMDEFLTPDRMARKIRPLSPESCSLDKLVETLLAEFPHQPIDIHWCSAHQSIVCDRQLLGIALANLVKNALRFSPVDRRVVISIDAQRKHDVVFCVSDEGPGIPPDEREKLFQKYFRGRAGQSQPGAGLGLFLVDMIAKAHGGSITVESEPGTGSHFKLTVPRDVRDSLGSVV